MTAPQIVPSLLAADPSRFGECLRRVKDAGAEWVSVDVMDGHFVPNLSCDPDHVRMAKAEGFFVDAHLMVANPETAAPWFAKAGADVVTVHWEACADPRAAVRLLRSLGCGAGLAVKPATPVEPILPMVGELDLALVMTVEPGFGGAKFLEGVLSKVSALRSAVSKSGRKTWIQVDGGINKTTVVAAAAAGADSLVAGTAVFGAKDIGAAFREIRENAKAAFASAA